MEGDLNSVLDLARCHYAYALNSPVSLTDPSGLCSEPDSSYIDSNGVVQVVGSEPCWWQIFGLGFCTVTGGFGCGDNGPNANVNPSGGGASGGGSAPAPAPKTTPAAISPNGPVAPQNPCQYQGRALAASDYATVGKNAPWYSLNFALNVKYGWGTGQYMDAQPLTSAPATWKAAAYGNYVYGVYMQAARVPLWVALRGAESYALEKTYPTGTPMQPWYPGLPVANAQNITNGYKAQAAGTTCQATAP